MTRLFLVALLALGACRPSSFTDRDACAKLIKLVQAERGIQIDTPEGCEQRVKARRQMVGDKEIDVVKQCIKDNDTLTAIERCVEKASVPDSA